MYSIVNIYWQNYIYYINNKYTLKNEILLLLVLILIVI